MQQIKTLNVSVCFDKKMKIEKRMKNNEIKTSSELKQIHSLQCVP